MYFTVIDLMVCCVNYERLHWSEVHVSYFMGILQQRRCKNTHQFWCM